MKKQEWVPVTVGAVGVNYPQLAGDGTGWANPVQIPSDTETPVVRRVGENGAVVWWKPRLFDKWLMSAFWWRLLHAGEMYVAADGNGLRGTMTRIYGAYNPKNMGRIALLRGKRQGEMVMTKGQSVSGGWIELVAPDPIYGILEKAWKMGVVVVPNWSLACGNQVVGAGVGLGGQAVLVMRPMMFNGQPGHVCWGSGRDYGKSLRTYVYWANKVEPNLDMWMSGKWVVACGAGTSVYKMLERLVLKVEEEWKTVPEKDRTEAVEFGATTQAAMRILNAKVEALDFVSGRVVEFKLDKGGVRAKQTGAAVTEGTLPLEHDTMDAMASACVEGKETSWKAGEQLWIRSTFEKCPTCGRRVKSSEMKTCGRCGNRRCTACMKTCEECGGVFCAGCMTTCQSCEKEVCYLCQEKWQKCEVCGGAMCKECTKKDTGWVKCSHEGCNWKMCAKCAKKAGLDKKEETACVVCGEKLGKFACKEHSKGTVCSGCGGRVCERCEGEMMWDCATEEPQPICRKCVVVWKTAAGTSWFTTTERSTKKMEGLKLVRATEEEAKKWMEG